MTTCFMTVRARARCHSHRGSTDRSADGAGTNSIRDSPTDSSVTHRSGAATSCSTLAPAAARSRSRSVRAGAAVIAVERHRDRAAELRRRFPGITVVEADATDLRLPRQPFHVVANPPFVITSALLRRLLQPGSRLLSAHLVLDERALIRWTGPDAPGAGRWRRDFDVTVTDRLPRSAFHPAPSVPCRVLHLRRRRR